MSFDQSVALQLLNSNDGELKESPRTCKNRTTINACRIEINNLVINEERTFKLVKRGFYFMNRNSQ